MHANASCDGAPGNPASAREAATDRYRVLLLLAVAALAYLPALFNGFVYDEHALLLPIEAYWQPDLTAILTTPVNGFEYLPVRDLTLALDAWIWGKNPAGFHLSNLVYYLAAVWLALGALTRLTRLSGSPRHRQIALAAAFIFALHPLNSEAVYFISARNNILAFAFVMLSLTGFLRGRWLWAALAFIVALFSKASAVFYPVALLAICLVLPITPENTRTKWTTLVVLFFIDFAALAAHLYIADAEGMIQPDLTRVGILDPALSIQRALLIPAYYLYRFVVPWPLNIILDEEALISDFASYTAASVLFAIYLIAIVVAWRHRRRSALPFVGLTWFFVALGPVLNLIPTYPMVAERYLFPGMMGLSLLVAALVVPVARSRLGLGAFIGVLAVWGATVMLRGADWRTDQSLFGAAYRVTPGLAAFPYVVSLLDGGAPQTALGLARAGKLPDYLRELVEGEVAAGNHQADLALAHFQRAEALGEFLPDVVRGRIHHDLGKLHEQSGRPLAALAHYLRLTDPRVQWSREFYGQHAQRRIEQIRLQLTDRRRQVEARALRDPGNVVSQGEFGVYLLKTGEYALAAEYLDRADRLQPGNFGILFNLALAHLRADAPEAAQKAFERARRLRPDDTRVLNHLALLYSREGRNGDAVALYRRAIDDEGNDFDARINLTRLLLRLGEVEEARDVLEEGLSRYSGEQAARYRNIVTELRANASALAVP